MRATWLIAVVLCVAACGSHEPAAPHDTPHATAPAHGGTPTPVAEPGRGAGTAPAVVQGAALPHPEPLDDLHDIDETPEPGDVALPAGDVASNEVLDAAAPAHGCVPITRAPSRVWPRSGPAAVVAVPTGFVVAGYAPGELGGEEVFAVLVAPGHPQTPLARFPLAAAAADGARDGPPAIADRQNGQALLVVADGHGTLRAASLHLLGGQSTPELVSIGEGADLRFAPALVVTDGVPSVAYTDGRGTPMRVRLVTLHDDLHAADTRDLTPEAMGASTPVALGDELVFLDAHGGLSPIVRVPLGVNGAPSPAIIERALSTVSQPAHLAAAHVGSARYVAYTAIGRAATSAIGVVRLGDTEAPSPLVPGTGYGRLHLAAVDATASAIFAADHPVTGAAATEEVKTDVTVRVLDAAGLGAPLTVAEPGSHRAGAPSLARAQSGTVALAFRTDAGVYVQFLRCADR